MAPNSGESSSGQAWDIPSSAAGRLPSVRADLGRMQIAFHNSLPVAASAVSLSAESSTPNSSRSSFCIFPRGFTRVRVDTSHWRNVYSPIELLVGEQFGERTTNDF